MPVLECRLISHAASEHLDQLYAGFLALRNRGLIRLSQHCTRQGVASSTEQHLRNAGGGQLRVVVDGDIRVHYDAHDAVEINRSNLEQCDFYFKRSFSPAYIARLPGHAHKVFPLGLNYRVLADSVDRFSLERALVLRKGLTAKLLSCIDALDARNLVKYNPRVRHLEELPEQRLPPRVLFLTTAYDPYDEADRSRRKVEERIEVNETRAACIRVLRRELGASFLGGFSHSPYAVENYRECLVRDNGVTRKASYLGLLRSYPICVATKGLHGSIGWKFAEYVALAKAIVSERLSYAVPGDMEPGRNYLQFDSPDECAEQCARLMEDRALAMRLMLNNARYYECYLRPDALVLNTLLKVLSASCARPGPLQAPHTTPAEARLTA